MTATMCYCHCHRRRRHRIDKHSNANRLMQTQVNKKTVVSNCLLFWLDSIICVWLMFVCALQCWEFITQHEYEYEGVCVICVMRRNVRYRHILLHRRLRLCRGSIRSKWLQYDEMWLLWMVQIMNQLHFQFKRRRRTTYEKLEVETILDSKLQTMKWNEYAKHSQNKWKKRSKKEQWIDILQHIKFARTFYSIRKLNIEILKQTKSLNACIVVFCSGLGLKNLLIYTFALASACSAIFLLKMMPLHNLLFAIKSNNSIEKLS